MAYRKRGYRYSNPYFSVANASFYDHRNHTLREQSQGIVNRVTPVHCRSARANT
jgi:hypothetical protein